jgi:hypothetical protein
MKTFVHTNLLADVEEVNNIWLVASFNADLFDSAFALLWLLDMEGPSLERESALG